MAPFTKHRFSLLFLNCFFFSRFSSFEIENGIFVLYIVPFCVLLKRCILWNAPRFAIHINLVGVVVCTMFVWLMLMKELWTLSIVIYAHWISGVVPDRKIYTANKSSQSDQVLITNYSVQHIFFPYYFNAFWWSIKKRSERMDGE